MLNQICRNEWCKQQFTVPDEDLTFLEEVSPFFNGKKERIPPPTLCPLCRAQRRMAWRNHNFVYRLQANAPGEATFSLWSPDMPFASYTTEFWFSDGWDQHASAQEIDFGRPFFAQWKEVNDRSPRFALDVVRMQNSDYSNNADDSKNVYLCFNVNASEDSIACDNLVRSKDCLDCTRVFDSELCANCVDCENSYLLQDSQSCENCSESLFLLNCQSCRHCIGCVNLQRAEYCIFNEQKTKEEYDAFIKSVAWDSWTSRSQFASQFWDWAKQHPHPHAVVRMSEDWSGNYIVQSRAVQNSEFIRTGEYLRYCQLLFDNVDHCLDITLFGLRASYCYEGGILGLDAQRVHFSNSVWEGTSDMLYCQYCVACHHCFGCIGLHRKNYCIFNRQYSKEEYNALVPKLIAQMRATGEWGEFFPIELSTIPYNRSLAQQYFPLTREEALERGFSWYEEPEAQTEGEFREHEDTAQDDSPKLLRSESSGRPYRLSTAEIGKYRRFGLPLPRETYDERMRQRSKRMGGLTLRERQCAKTGRMLQTVYSEEDIPALWDREEWEREFRG